MNLSNDVVSVSMSAFNQASSLTNLFVVPVVLGRIAYLNTSGSQSSDYSRLAKGVVLYFCLIFGFETILTLLVSIPEHFAPDFSSVAQSAEGSRSTELMGSAPVWIAWLLETVIAFLYHAATFFNFAIAILLSSMAPVIFLLGGILNIGLGVETFFSLLVLVSSWPIIFAACEAMRLCMVPGASSAFGKSVFEILIAFFKVVAPLAVARTALQSHAAQAMKSVVSTGGSGVASGVHHAKNFHAGLSGKEMKTEPRSLSQIAAHTSTKLAHSAGGAVRDLSGEKSKSNDSSAKHNRASQNTTDQRDLSPPTHSPTRDN